MHRAKQRCRRFVRRAQRRARVLGRSLLLHVLVLVLIGLGLLARMTESSDVQLALAEHAAALARLDPPAPPSAAPYAAHAWNLPAPRVDVSALGGQPPAPSRLDAAPAATRHGAAGSARRAVTRADRSLEAAAE